MISPVTGSINLVVNDDIGRVIHGHILLLRAVCKKILIDEDENISYVPSDAVAVAKSPVTQQKHAGSVEIDHSITAETGVHLGEVSNFSHLVDPGGLEPPTPCMPCRCATSCAMGPYAPNGTHLL